MQPSEITCQMNVLEEEPIRLRTVSFAVPVRYLDRDAPFVAVGDIHREFGDGFPFRESSAGCRADREERR